MKYLVLAVILMSLLKAPCQAETQPDAVDCSRAFDDLVLKLEANYIGLKQIAASAEIENYKATKGKHKETANNTGASQCTKVLQDFLTYFADGHVFVYERPKYNPDELDTFKDTIKSNKKRVQTLKSTLTLENNPRKLNSFDEAVGKWTDGSSEIVVVKEMGNYNAYILSSTREGIEAGELKASFSPTDDSFEGTYYSYDYAPRYFQGDTYKEGTLFYLGGGIYWGKLESPYQREVNMINRSKVIEPTIQELDDNNILFSIPSFMVDYAEFSRILTDNLEIIRNTTNLIIDIRGNTGGNGIYLTFLGTYADASITSSQGLVLASEENKIYFERLAKNSPEIYGPVAKAIEKNMGHLVGGPLYPENTFEPFESKIENVAILTDEGCISAAESFILHSRDASGRVTTFGSPTGGVIDYTSVNILKLDSGNQNIYFGYPTSTYHGDIPEKGHNKTGIIPDVPIDDTVIDKIKFIINYYEKDKDKKDKDKKTDS